MEPKKKFRIYFLLHPGYLAGRFREIKSPGELFSRLRGIFRYFFLETGNFLYSCRGSVIRASALAHDAYYECRGRVMEEYYRQLPVMRGVWTSLLKPARFLWDVRSDAVLTASISGFKPGKNTDFVKNPPSPASGKEDRPHLSWNIHLSCNYNCPYCWFHDGWEAYLGKSVALGAREWRIHWDRFNDRHGPAHIDIAGGEPFTYPGFLEILSSLAERNTVSVSTNFFWDPALIAGRVDPSKVGFSCSFHPAFSGPADVFADKILRLRKAGFHADASVVAYPPYLGELVKWNDSFFSRGVNLTVQPFRGYWKGRYYPIAYTAAAKRALSWFITGEYSKHYPPEVVSAANDGFTAVDSAKPGMMISYQMGLKSTLGTSCNSGRLYGRLQYNGDMQRCSQGGYVGNFLDENFRMYSAESPCPFPCCECSNEMIYMHGGPLGPGADL